MKNAKIIGVGHYAPPKIWTNHDLEQMMDTSDEWIRQRTGIEQRHIAEPGVGSSDLGYEAALRAIDDAGLKPNDIDLIVFATLSPDYYFPGNGVLLQKKLGIAEIGAIDVRQQCSGFIYGLSVANAYIKAGEYRHVLVVGAEVQHSFLEFTTEGRNTAVIFGDAAGAVVVAPTEEDGILSTHLHSQGEFAEMLYIEGPSPKREPHISHQDIDDRRHRIVMEGGAVFKHAVRRFAESINEALAANNKQLDDVDLFVLHQANIRISNV
ncbi:MAG: ketoacyl-ACP synthase III, partial [Candidatus Hydrogenedentes bacterium]|nr:ketoacyl-ACP synthase III [Candidatus Hydrogenedentota bacterium]